MIIIWNNLRLSMQKGIVRRRKKRYGKIEQLSDSQAVFRTGIMAIESWIMGENARWDLQYAKAQSPIERRLYNALLRKGYKPRTQVKCGKYYIDIALTQYKIAIECDGRAYHSSPKQKQHDHRKNQFLKRRGWEVLRFTGSQINGKLGYALSNIDKAIKERKVPFYKRLLKNIF